MPRAMNFLLAPIKVKCKNEACEETPKLTDLVEHQNSCKLCPDCKFKCKECNQFIEFRDTEHEEACGAQRREEEQKR